MQIMRGKNIDFTNFTYGGNLFTFLLSFFHCVVFYLSPHISTQIDIQSFSFNFAHLSPIEPGVERLIRPITPYEN